MDNYDLIINNKNPETPNYEFNYFNVRNNAWEFLIKNDIREFPLDLRKIALNNNWQILSYKKYCELNNLSESELISRHPDGFTQIVNNSFLICYNQNNDRERNRFTIAHEMGHIVLHKTYKGNKLEKEANMFAARILMPMLLIKELNLQSAEELTKVCDVSIEAATFRFNRFEQIKGREKFYTNPLEIELKNKLKNYINKNKH